MPLFFKKNDTEQKCVVSAVSGGTYTRRILLTVELKTWAAKLTCIYECGVNLIFSHPAFTCSKLTIKTLEQGVKYVQR